MAISLSNPGGSGGTGMRLPSALPTLAGGWLKMFQIVWFALFAVAVVGGTVGNWSSFASVREGLEATYGAGIRLVVEPTHITVSPLVPETAALGIVPGSTLVAVDGQKVGDENTEANWQAIVGSLGGPDGAIRRLTLRSPDGA